MELLHRQAAIAKLRGEPDLSDVLRDIVIEESTRLKESKAARLRAVNAVLTDSDR